MLLLTYLLTYAGIPFSDIEIRLETEEAGSR